MYVCVYVYVSVWYDAMMMDVVIIFYYCEIVVVGYTRIYYYVQLQVDKSQSQFFFSSSFHSFSFSLSLSLNDKQTSTIDDSYIYCTREDSYIFVSPIECSVPSSLFFIIYSSCVSTEAIS